MADGAGAGADVGGGSAGDFDDDWLDNMTLWTDRVDRLVWAYKIVDKHGYYNRHCHKGTVPDSASKLLPLILPDKRDQKFLCKFDIDLHSAMFENGERFHEDWDCARNLLIVLMRKYFWRVDGDRIVVVEYVIDEEHPFPQDAALTSY